VYEQTHLNVPGIRNVIVKTCFDLIRKEASAKTLVMEATSVRWFGVHANGLKMQNIPKCEENLDSNSTILLEGLHYIDDTAFRLRGSRL
jgi:hypothetical protein